MNNANQNIADNTINLVRRIVREFTFDKDQLKLWKESLGRTNIINLQVAKSDMPRIIGKKGAHWHALFNLVEQIGLRHSIRLRLECREPEPGEIQHFPPFQPAPQWDSRPVVQLVRDIVQAVFAYPADVWLTDSAHSPTSVIQVVVRDQENRSVVDRVAESLKVLFNAVGKRHGRILLLEVITGSQADSIAA